MDEPAHNTEEVTPPLIKEKEETRVNKIIQQITKLHAEHGETFKIDERLWTELNPLLFDYRKLRVNYFRPSGRLVVQMGLGVLHDAFVASLEKRIVHQLAELSRGPEPAAKFAKDVRPTGSSRINPSDTRYGVHEPDAAFRKLGARARTVIIEVADSQKGKDLRRIAQDYILGSDLDTRVVITIDLDHRKHKGATFTVWRAALQGDGNDEAWAVEPTILDQSFRLDNGQPVNDTTLGISLRLAEFGDSKQDDGIEGEIFVSCKELYECLQEAEDCIECEELCAKEMPATPRQMRKRRRATTPPEQLTEADEAVYTEAEERVAKRLEIDDSYYQGSF